MKLVYTQKFFGAKIRDGVMDDYTPLGEDDVEKIRLFGQEKFLKDNPEYDAVAVCRTGPPKSEYRLE